MGGKALMLLDTYWGDVMFFCGLLHFKNIINESSFALSQQIKCILHLSPRQPVWVTKTERYLLILFSKHRLDWADSGTGSGHGMRRNQISFWNMVSIWYIVQQKHLHFGALSISVETHFFLLLSTPSITLNEYKLFIKREKREKRGRLTTDREQNNDALSISSILYQ